MPGDRSRAGLTVRICLSLFPEVRNRKRDESGPGDMDLMPI